MSNDEVFANSINIAEFTVSTVFGKTPWPKLLINGVDVTARTIEVIIGCNGYRAKLCSTMPPTKNESGEVEAIELILESLTVKHE